MEKMLGLKAYAKVNLQLDVLGRRSDGYHELAGVMQSISLYDDVTLAASEAESARIAVDFDLEVPFDNTVRKAAKLFLSDSPYSVTVSVKKHIPSEAGLGGASADAAAVLQGLNTLFEGTKLERTNEELAAIGLAVGADVPFCLQGGCAVARGVGERLCALPSLPLTVFIIKGERGVSTGRLFELFDRQCGEKSGPQLPDYALDKLTLAIREGDLAAIGRNMCNALQPAAQSIAPEIGEHVSLMKRFGALGACMTGSGSASVGVFADRASAEPLSEHLAARRSACGEKLFFGVFDTVG